MQTDFLKCERISGDFSGQLLFLLLTIHLSHFKGKIPIPSGEASLLSTTLLENNLTVLFQKP